METVSSFTRWFTIVGRSSRDHKFLCLCHPVGGSSPRHLMTSRRVVRRQRRSSLTSQETTCTKIAPICGPPGPLAPHVAGNRCMMMKFHRMWESWEDSHLTVESRSGVCGRGTRGPAAINRRKDGRVSSLKGPHWGRFHHANRPCWLLVFAWRTRRSGCR